MLVYEYPSAADVGLLQEQAAPAEEGSSRQDAKKREEEAKELERIAEAKALQDVAQLESDHETACQLQRDMEEEETAKLAEQDLLARQLQKQLEEEERAHMADIRAAQERDNHPLPQQASLAGKPADPPPVAENVSAAQKRLSLDPDTWSLVLQVMWEAPSCRFLLCSPPVVLTFMGSAKLSEMGFGNDYEQVLKKKLLSISRLF